MTPTFHTIKEPLLTKSSHLSSSTNEERKRDFIIKEDEGFDIAY